uniref:Uncharacterized protein n=1 Tax=Cacopsylla melanoneura TaxID=428564 RepID=A0A8D8LQU2_9HEMI
METKLKQEQNRISALVDENATQINQLLEEIDDKQKQYQTLIKQNDKIQKELSDKNSCLNEEENDIQSLKEQLEQAQSSKNDLQITIKTLQKTNNDQEINFQSLNNELQNSKKEINDLHKIIDKQETTITKNENSIYELEELLKGSQMSILALQKTIKTMQKQQDEQHFDLNTKSLLQELNETGILNTTNLYSNNQINQSIDMFEESTNPYVSPEVIIYEPPEDLTQTKSHAPQNNGHGYKEQPSIITEILQTPQTTTNETPITPQVRANLSENVYLIGDSIAASIKNILTEKLPTGSNLVDYTKGGIGIQKANMMFKEEAKQTDFAVLVVGTNDLFQTPWEQMEIAIMSLLSKLKQCKKVVMVQILRRYDIPRINLHIAKLNTRIKHLVSSYDNIHFVENKTVRYEHLNDDGLHLNKTGKVVLTNKVSLLLCNNIQQTQTNATQSHLQTTMTERAHTNKRAKIHNMKMKKSNTKVSHTGYTKNYSTYQHIPKTVRHLQTHQFMPWNHNLGSYNSCNCNCKNNTIMHPNIAQQHLDHLGYYYVQNYPHYNPHSSIIRDTQTHEKNPYKTRIFKQRHHNTHKEHPF